MGREQLQLDVSIKTTTRGARRTRACGQQSNASTTQSDAKRKGQTSNNDKRLRADQDPDSLRKPELGGTPTKKPRITSFGVSLDDLVNDECSLQSFSLRKIIADPGVRRELASWRWLAIYALVVVYSIVIAHHIIPNADTAQSKLDAQSESNQFQLDAESGHHQSQELLTTALEDVQHEDVQTLQNANIAHKKATRTVQNLNTDAQCYRDSAHAASIELAQLRAEVRNASEPLVLGGIGDSGTRAVAYLVTQLGVWMGKYGETVKKDSRDSRLFINGFNTVACDEDGVSTVEGIVKSYVFYSRSLAPCGSLAYNQSCISNELTWNRGTQWTSALLRTLWRDTKTYTPKAANREMYAFGLWGFKHPRASFILPYINHVLDGNFKYVHIVRDGRDIAAGDNQYFFNSICKKYHGPDSELCTDKYENKLELWARLNLDILRFARENFDPKQFMVVRIEDFVLGDPSCFQRLADFSGTSRARADNVIGKSIRLFTVKKDRYFGNKYSATQRREFTQAAAGNLIIRRAYQALGYGIDPWQPVASCSEIPAFGFS